MVRTLTGDVPEELTDDAIEVTEDRHVLPFSRASARLVTQLEGTDLDSLAIGCVREIREGVEPAGRGAERGGRRGRRAHADAGHDLGPRARA